MLPGNGRALLGLQQAFGCRGRAANAEALGPRIDERIVAMAGDGRGVEAAMLKAGVETALTALRQEPSFDRVLSTFSAHAR